MAKIDQVGSNSVLLIGIQTAEGVMVPNIDSPDGTAGKMIDARFLMTGLPFGERSEVTESETFVGGRQSAASQRGQLWCDGAYNFEVLPANIRHLIRIIMNPDTLPAGEAIFHDETTTDPSHSISLSDSSGANAISSDNVFVVPSQLTFSGSGTGTVKIVGKRRIGKPTEEQDPYTETLVITADDRKSVNYFSSISAINVVDGDLGARTTVSANPNTKEYAYTFNTSGVVPYKTLQFSKGNVPELAIDVRVDSFTLTIGDIITAVLNLSGKKTTLFSHLPVSGTDGAVTGAVKLPDNYLDNFPKPAIDFFPRWGGELIFDGTARPFTGLDMEINNNPSTGVSKITGSRFRTSQVLGARKSTMSPTVIFEADDMTYNADDNWQHIFRAGIRAELKLTLFNYLSNGRRERIEIVCPAAELAEPVPVEVTGDAEIEIPLIFDCGGSSSNASELTITVDAA